jgi:hypothetical protein
MNLETRKAKSIVNAFIKRTETEDLESCLQSVVCNLIPVDLCPALPNRYFSGQVIEYKSPYSDDDENPKLVMLLPTMPPRGVAVKLRGNAYIMDTTISPGVSFDNIGVHINLHDKTCVLSKRSRKIELHH